MLSLFTGMTGRMKRHSALDENETLFHACYGLGAAIVAAGNRAVSRHSSTWDVPQGDGQVSRRRSTAPVCWR